MYTCQAVVGVNLRRNRRLPRRVAAVIDVDARYLAEAPHFCRYSKQQEPILIVLIRGGIFALHGTPAYEARQQHLIVHTLLRRHANRAVETDGLAVQHLVLDDVLAKPRELLRPA